jgi:hypothetical protein
MTGRPLCRFGDGPAVVHVALDKGCVCFRDDREQWLCWHHRHKSTPIGSFDVIEEL